MGLLRGETPQGAGMYLGIVGAMAGIPDPALPPSLFGVRAFTAANATIALTNLAMYATFIAVPIALAATGQGAAASGLVLTSVGRLDRPLAPD